MGKLLIVATPIGNQGDITLRALETLGTVDGIICEDSRRTGLLLTHYQIKKPLLVVNDFNERQAVVNLIEKLKQGAIFALVSDAGTPLISDPGFALVRSSIAEGIVVEHIPGPSVVTAALVLSGLPPDKFLFLGFLPKKAGPRRKLLVNLTAINRYINPTVIIFESPFRLVKTLRDIEETLGDIDIVVCRELTKIYQEVRREKVSGALAHFTVTRPKGEFVILFTTKQLQTK